MLEISVENLCFTFPDEWEVSKYDDWEFYRKNFCYKSFKAVDLMAISPDKEGFLIEVKDYRKHPRTKVVDIAAEIRKKVFDTLAVLLPAKIWASEKSEKELAAKFLLTVLSTKRIHIIFHLEQPKNFADKLHRTFINPVNILQKLQQLLHPLDPIRIVVEGDSMRSCRWQVQDLPKS